MVAHQETQNREPRGRGGSPQPDSGFPVELSRPAIDALHEAGYTRLDHLAGVPESALIALHGFGPKGMRIIRDALQAQDLATGKPEGR